MSLLKRIFQRQKSGDNSQNFQVTGNVTVGVSAQEARQIALDLFEANVYKFSEKAANKAKERVEEFTDIFIKDFYEKNPHLSKKLEEPSVQSSLYIAQKEYAKTGDKELEERLLTLLRERINSEERSLKQIVLDEALLILPKLTNEQVSILTLIFSAVRLNLHTIKSIPSFIDFFNNKLLKFFPPNIKNPSFFTHMQSSGCCIAIPEGATYKPLEELFKTRYKGLFIRGFSEQEFKSEVDENIDKYTSLLTPCLHSPLALQFNALNDDVLEIKIASLKLIEVGDKIRSLWNKSVMTEEEIKKYLIEINPKSEKLLNDWKGEGLKTIQLTSIGYAIAIMNYNKETGANIQMDHFI